MTMELPDYARILWAYRRSILVVTLGAVAAAAAMTLLQPTTYEAHASGFVSYGTVINPSEAEASDSVARSRAKSYIDIAESRATAEAVIDRLKLQSTASDLINRIAVEQPVDTVLLKITAKASTPPAAQQLADAWVLEVAHRVTDVENPENLSNATTLQLVPIEAAELPSAPASPRLAMNLLLGLALGVVAAVVLALSRNRFDRRIRSEAAVKERFSVPVVGVVPASATLAREPDGSLPMAVGDVERSISQQGAADAFRRLRTHLQFTHGGTPPRVVVVTSPGPGDGTSITAANLAATVAAAGQQVVVLDAHLRSPSLGETFSLGGKIGLTDVLAGQALPQDALQETGQPSGLRVMVAGTMSADPSEQVASRAMHDLLRTLAQDCVVVIDAPPLLSVTDAAVLTMWADGALVVVSVGRTLDEELETALEGIVDVGGHVLGIVLNRVPRRDVWTRQRRAGRAAPLPTPTSSRRDPLPARRPLPHPRTARLESRSD